MRRWLLWFVLAPQTFLLAGLLRDLGLPFDATVLHCLFLAFFAERGALAGLLLGAAMGRALVDEAALSVHLLVLGVPVALLLPLRRWFFGQRWIWQATTAALLAFAVPRLSGLCGRVFDQPSVSSAFDGMVVVTSAIFLPPLLWCLRAVPPFAAFAEDDE
ncbi:MAG: hypothetical protein KDE27_18175 [Planctomycetes bacterium]|nr:hypothetical protein [Planctomycetota bacterium]